MLNVSPLVFAAFVLAQSPSSPTPLTIGETFTLQSEVLGELRRINVYTPPVADPSKPLPVLYMPDGGMAEDFLHVAGLIQVLVGNGTMQPCILVGIENTQRRRDTTGPTTVEEDKKIAPRVGGSVAFRRFIRTELMPAIEKRYRTTQEKAIVGESLAGLFVVETLLLEPDLFETYIAFDPSLWWNDDHLIKTAAEGLRKVTAPRTLYLASSKDAADLVGKFSEVLRAQAPKTVRWHYERMPDETHATIYHPAALKAFRSLFGAKKQ
jgi:uncharacterized protein